MIGLVRNSDRADWEQFKTDDGEIRRRGYRHVGDSITTISLFESVGPTGAVLCDSCLVVVENPDHPVPQLFFPLRMDPAPNDSTLITRMAFHRQ